jgi:hypothetical protein
MDDYSKLKIIKKHRQEAKINQVQYSNSIFNKIKNEMNITDTESKMKLFRHNRVFSIEDFKMQQSTKKVKNQFGKNLDVDDNMNTFKDNKSINKEKEKGFNSTVMSRATSQGNFFDITRNSNFYKTDFFNKTNTTHLSQMNSTLKTIYRKDNNKLGIIGDNKIDLYKKCDPSVSNCKMNFLVKNNTNISNSKLLNLNIRNLDIGETQDKEETDNYKNLLLYIQKEHRQKSSNEKFEPDIKISNIYEPEKIYDKFNINKEISPEEISDIKNQMKKSKQNDFLQEKDIPFVSVINSNYENPIDSYQHLKINRQINNKVLELINKEQVIKYKKIYSDVNYNFIFS